MVYPQRKATGINTVEFGRDQWQAQSHRKFDELLPPEGQQSVRAGTMIA
jgi:hypothetical protein